MILCEWRRAYPRMQGAIHGKSAQKNNSDCHEFLHCVLVQLSQTILGPAPRHQVQRHDDGQSTIKPNHSWSRSAVKQDRLLQ